MKFHQHESYFDFNRRKAKFFRKPYPEVLTALVRDAVTIQQNPSSSQQEIAAAIAMDVGCTIEKIWYDAIRPFFKVWPSILPALTSVKLDLSLDDLQLERRVVALRMPVGHEPVIGGARLHSILSCIQLFNSGRTGLAFAATGSGGHEVGEWTFSDTFGFDVDDARLVEEQIAEKTFVDDSNFLVPVLPVAVRIALAVHLLANDPTIIEPEVLAKDRRSFEETGDTKYIEKAKKRGIVGWNLGKAFEAMPHYRRPHLGLRWTGEGRKVPKIVPVKGAVVHRKKMTQVPTGYVLPDGTEVEPVNVGD